MISHWLWFLLKKNDNNIIVNKWKTIEEECEMGEYLLINEEDDYCDSSN